MAKPDKKPPTHVIALIKKHTKPLPPIPQPPRAGVIPAESLWSRFRRRRNR